MNNLLVKQDLTTIAPTLDCVVFGVDMECPKCGSNSARYEVTKQDVYLRCLCGLCKLVATTVQTMTIEHVDAGDEVSLPRRDTKLWKCLVVLHSLRQATTQEITESLNALGNDFTASDVASQLTVLRYKGLVMNLNKLRGKAGGSTWEVASAAKTLLGSV